MNNQSELKHVHLDEVKVKHSNLLTHLQRKRSVSISCLASILFVHDMFQRTLLMIRNEIRIKLKTSARVKEYLTKKIATNLILLERYYRAPFSLVSAKQMTFG